MCHKTNIPVVGDNSSSSLIYMMPLPLLCFFSRTHCFVHSCQPYICRSVLHPLVNLTVSGTPPQSEFASSVLLNCADNPFCRAIMFETQVRMVPQSQQKVERGTRHSRDCPTLAAGKAIPCTFGMSRAVATREGWKVITRYTTIA